MAYLLKRLSEGRIWRKLYRERFSEPIHLNVISFFVFLFGSFRKKVDYDLVLRPQQAFAILSAADRAKEQGFSRVSILEFGVANGAGLMNMIEIANKVTKATGVEIDIYGFDTGEGMPEPVDYRDHPEYYNVGDFPMNKELLKRSIEGKAKLIFGTIDTSLPKFIESLNEQAPIGFVSIDVDYYSSTTQVLDLFKTNAKNFLPLTYVYFDDIFMPHHNKKCGELLAIDEFNNEMKYRELSHHTFFINERLFKNAHWIKQLYYLHVLDHPHRFETIRDRKAYVLDNPYLDFEGNKKQFD
ncbi:hypothetical protein M0G43_13075 [Subsaxibacter sp. CAU 1640]|uniref:hypothetical protein n=1 Tax=Subsaxibacter sp. CAU 1640 TaxID=2933271 RepID=UPI0020037A57|nr:hypothetical protein [Subsaxibacter sp. CAU 1640]MCK7591512.1 hypothetical protein [Subsaxibacter sp. CAU 1640]